MTCIFCKIVRREIPAQLLYEDDAVVAFRDINPMAPVHILVVPKVHVERLDSPELASLALGERVFSAVAAIAKNENLSPNGFRVVCNTGAEGGQTVNHLHFHVLAGRRMTWPPG